MFCGVAHSRGPLFLAEGVAGGGGGGAGVGRRKRRRRKEKRKKIRRSKRIRNMIRIWSRGMRKREEVVW